MTGIKQKKKLCKGFGRVKPHEAYLFSGGRCMNCNHLYKSAQAKSNGENYGLKRTPLKPSKGVKGKPKAIRQRTAKNVLAKAEEIAAGKKYWESKADFEDIVRCEETGDPIGTKDNYNHALLCHILGKQSHPHLRANLENFIILKYELHQVLDNVGDEAYKKSMLPNTWSMIQSKKLKLKLGDKK